MSTIVITDVPVQVALLGHPCHVLTSCHAKISDALNLRDYVHIKHVLPLVHVHHQLVLLPVLKSMKTLQMKILNLQ